MIVSDYNEEACAADSAAVNYTTDCASGRAGHLDLVLSNEIAGHVSHVQL